MVAKRILVVDDSCLYQRILSDTINSYDSLEVVGIASNGKIALDMLEELKPDLVTLDILMPEMDGIQTLIEIRKKWPDIRTILVSTLTAEGSDAALDALALGASEHAAKPGTSGGIGAIRTGLAEDLMPKIEALCGLDLKPAKPITPTKPEPAPECAQPIRVKAAPVTRKVIAGGIDLVAIGVSTGGPDALAKLFTSLPADIGVPIVIVQHMPAQFTTKLAKRLDTASELTVKEAQVGDKLRAGTVYIAPGNYHMILDRINDENIVSLNKAEPENSCRPSVDPLFRSIPAIYGARCLGVIMTGMGSDGLNGCQALVAAGCPVIVQDKATSIVWGMPKLVAKAGLARQEVALNDMADVIERIVKESLHYSGKVANSDNFVQSGVVGRGS